MLLTDRSLLLSIPVLWRSGFRAFFLGGAGFAVLAVLLWMAALSGLLSDWQPAGGWLVWHRHEMPFGFASAIIAGFLLTAVQNWTGRATLQGYPLMALFGCWLAARLAWLTAVPLWLLIPLELLFLPLLAVCIGRNLWQARQVRNYPVLAVLTLLSLADLQVLLGLYWADEQAQRLGAFAALWLIAALMGLIGGRVIPFFTQRGLGRTAQVPAWPWLDNALLAGSILVAVLTAAGFALLPQPLVAVLFAALAAGHLLRWWRWQDAGIWQVPLLWSLHLAYLWLALACAGMAAWHFGLPLPVSLPLHALTVGAMAGLILAMIARVSLGHTGRALQPPKAMFWAFLALNLGAVLRVFGVLWLPEQALPLASACWVIAFFLFVWHYAPILCQPRPDGQPG